MSFLKGLREFWVADPAAFDAFTKHLAATGKLHGPVKKRNRFALDKVNTASDLRLDYDVTIIPPKKFFLPPRQALINFLLAPEASTSPIIDTEGLILFGLHPYDVAGLNVLDHVFFERNPDPSYLAKRRNSIVIGMTPQKVSERNFAYQMGAADVEDGYDLFFTRTADGKTLFEVASRPGKDLVTSFGQMKPASGTEVEAGLAYRAEQAKMMNHQAALFSYTELPALLERHHEHWVWAAKSETCFSCGTCNLVCPTCYCFDVRDEVNLDAKGGQRARFWDGCLLESFAAVAHGENFRSNAANRYRHRYMRKGRYVFENSGVMGCVGCGRCSQQCLPDIADPVEVFNILKRGV